MFALMTLIAIAVSAMLITCGCVGNTYRGPFVEVNGEFGGFDDLGRELPLAGASMPSAKDRKVGVFYFLWQGEHGVSGPFDNYKIVLNDPDAILSEKNWIKAGGGKVGAHHFWGEPMFGYYVSSDEWVMRKHAQMLIDAGIDYVVFDTTNAVPYLARVKQLIGVWYDFLEQGYRPPQLSFYTNTSSPELIKQFYYELYTNEALREKYPRLDELWFNWDGKPMIIGRDYEYYLPVEIEEYFTIKDSVWPTEGRTDNGFPWMEFGRLGTDQAVYGRDGRREVVNVSVAQHNVTVNMAAAAWYGGADRTRSWRDGAVDTSPDAIMHGYNFASQWEWALNVDPETVFVTGWNEWVAQRQPSSPSTPVNFVDCANPEASRDIEPMNGLFGDNYYMQLISYVRQYKGLTGRVRVGDKITIDVNGGFDQWDDERITAKYTDYEGDTADRRSKGFGGIKYEDRTGRNDFVAFKVCRDDYNIYFYAETAEDITPSTDDNWMTLFISSGMWRDIESAEYWIDGIDFAVNLEKPDEGGAVVSRYTGGSWVKAGNAGMKVEGNKMMISVSKRLICAEQGVKPIDVQFKWADNYQYNEDGTLDVWTFYRNGDSAPLGRMTYVFSQRR